MNCLLDLRNFLKKNRFALGLTLADFHCSLTTMARSSVKFDKMTAKFVALDTTFSIFVCTKIANTSFKRELLYAQKTQLAHIYSTAPRKEMKLVQIWDPKNTLPICKSLNFSDRCAVEPRNSAHNVLRFFTSHF